jgi:glycosyltransferase involved in cell wall biosynthesis
VSPGVADSDSIERALARSLIVIPSINGAHLLRRMLPTLNVPGACVLVLDQASTDDSETVCRDAGVGFLQLNHPHTYTQACNIGAEQARARGCEYLFVANNDITFSTDVTRELLVEMLADPELGIVAPSQLLVDPRTGERRLAYAVQWNLAAMEFKHEFGDPLGDPHRIESDFCELTFALIRMSTIDKVGFLDDAYGFYHEDADFGFRLRQAGFACAYLPKSQIEHFPGSSFSGPLDPKRLEYMRRSKQLFADKFSGYGVRHLDHKSKEASSWNIINRNLHPYLARFGLLDRARPELIFSHPGTPPFDYLYTVWETTRPPAEWSALAGRYKLVMTPSRWVQSVLEGAGFDTVHYVPHGVETDVFHPWGAASRFADNQTFLWFASNQHRKGLDVMLAAWRAFHAQRPATTLILLGSGIGRAMPGARQRAWKNFLIGEHPADGIVVYETVSPTSDVDLAAIYRGVDFLVVTSRSEGFGFVVAEAMATGVPVIFGNFSGTAEFRFDGALTYDGREVPADYADKGFGDVGNWWEPDADQLTARMLQASVMDRAGYDALAARGVRAIRSRFTWRNSALSLRAALATVQERKPASADTLPKGRPYGAASTPVRTLRRTGDLMDKAATILEDDGAKALLRTGRNYLGRFANRAGRSLRTRSARLMSRVAHPRPRRLGAKRGTLFIGYAEGGLGLGQSFRGTLRAAAGQPLEFGVYPFDVGIETRKIGPFMADRYDRGHVYDVNVIEVAPDQVPVVFGHVDPRLLQSGYNVLRPYWELPRAPTEWREMLRDIDELWVPNDYVGTAFRTFFGGTVTVIPPAVDVQRPAITDRARFGLEPGRFYFIFTFDYFSLPARKNPLGVVRAFQDAFPRGDENVGLVIKSTGAPDHYPDIKQQIREAGVRDPRIRQIDRSLSREDVVGLIDACDCYVSLHRAEGFGLGMAEAMLLDKPVIGTAFSGCVDFVTEATAFPVGYALRPVREDEYIWTAGQEWAEPSHGDAVAAMRQVVAEPELARAKAAAGKALVEARYSFDAVGAAMAARLQEIQAERGRA